MAPEVGLTQARRTAIDALVDEITEGGPVRRLLVFGPPGVGKTSALSRAARLLHGRGVDVVFFGSEDPIVSHGGRDGAGRHRAVIVDDPQLLDLHASELVELPERGPDGAPVTLLFSAIDAEQLTVELRRALLRSDTRFLELGPMDAHEVADLVIEHFRDATAPARRALTAELMRRSDGLPVVVEALIPLVDPNTYTMINPDTTDTETVESSIATASRYVAEGAYRKAVERLNALNQIDGVLNSAARSLLVSSLYGMGALDEADRIRATLVREALIVGDHEAAFRAAVLGLPAAELMDGDPKRLNELLAIHDEMLPAPVRNQHAVATVRQAVTAGRFDVARYWHRRAETLAGTADQRAAAMHSAWQLSAEAERPETSHRDLTVMLEGTLSDKWRALIHELRAIDNYRLGDLDDAVTDYQILGDHAAKAGDAVRTWHHLTFRATVAVDAGRWTEAEELRTEAVAHAMRNTLVGGEAMYVAQHFHVAWICDKHYDLVDMFGNIPPEIGRTRFGRAALVETLRAAGDVDRAVQLGRPLLQELMANHGHSTLVVLGFLTRFIAQTADIDVVEWAADLFKEKSGTAVMLGAGMASHGPADRYLFQLTGDPSHLSRAIAFADRAEYRLWQVLLRVEHPEYEVDGSGLMSRQARNLAADTDLVTLLTARSDRP